MDSVDVVVIDDDEGIRWILQQVLAMCNYSCDVAGDAARGISAVSRYRPRLAIIDIKLGAVNGFEVARMIRQDHNDVKILFVTGYKEAIADRVEAEENIVGVLEKPFNVKDLLKLVAEAVPVPGIVNSGSMPLQKVYDRMAAGDEGVYSRR